MKRYGIRFVVSFIFLLLGFYVGRYPYRNLKFYSNHNEKIIYPPKHPVYGLYLHELSYLLYQLKQKNLKELERRGNYFLDLALYDATKRKQILTEEEKEKLISTLMYVAVFREIYPRPKNIINNKKSIPIDSMLDEVIIENPNLYDKFKKSSYFDEYFLNGSSKKNSKRVKKGKQNIERGLGTFFFEETQKTVK
ncbi:MAG: hypothetical protein U9O87_11165 [Verrucomicrobiota bacterium]|nr:hypothetical protein [Verrucomicrobiota bacterium]